MFKSKTLFIVGAGASQEAGLPTGTQLKEAIAEKLSFGLTSGAWVGGDPDIHEAIRRYASQANVDANTIFRDAVKIRDAMPLAISIDNFIDAHSTAQGVVVCGKLGIAKAIVEAERNSRLSLPEEPGRRNDLNHDRISGTWYLSFFQLLTENIRKEDVDTLFDNFSVVTFNYDRCIEHYLYYAIRNYYGIENVDTIMKRLKIYHPYGVVGSLPWQDPRNNVSFGGVGWNANLLDIAKQIKTFTERAGAGDPTHAEIHLQVQEAEIVVFLGFAFHQLNMELLTPDVSGKVRRVFGTAKGKSEINITDIIIPEVWEMLKKPIDRHNTHVNGNLSCCSLFTEYWDTLSRG